MTAIAFGFDAENHSMDFEKWLVQVGKSEKTARNYAQAVDGSITNWAKDAGLVDGSLAEFKSADQLVAIIDQIKRMEKFVERDAKGKGMYSAALCQFHHYLADANGGGVEKDINQIVADNKLSATEKSVQISARIGQGKFRDMLIGYWGGCAISGYRDSRFLVASHIKPWSHSNTEERLDPFNGLLLLPNLDKVFDLGYITFEESGKIRISNAVEDIATLGIHDAMTVNLTEKHQAYMEYHRENKFWEQ